MSNPAAAVRVNCIKEEYLYIDCHPCACGEHAFTMTLQHLEKAENGSPLDVLEGQCPACGARREFVFDVTQAFGKIVPEVPSCLFDAAQWVGLLLNLSRHWKSAGDEQGDLGVRVDAWVAVEQALLFFDPGENAPRPEAFFNTPRVPAQLQPYLSRTFLEPVRQRMRDYMGWPPKPCAPEEDDTFYRTDDKMLYHIDCLPADARFPVTVVKTDMIDTEPVCAKCGKRFPAPEPLPPLVPGGPQGN